MRITNASMTNNYLSDVQNNLQKLDKLNTQLNSGQQINRVSDDPYKAIRIMNMKNEINNVDKFNSNCDEITGWLDMTDEALNQIGTISSEIKTLITSISGTISESEIKAIKNEINEKVKQIGESLNTTYGGKYVFGGSKTDVPPVKVIENDEGIASIVINLESNTEKLKVEISSGIKLDYNLTTDQVTGNGSGLTTLNGIVSTLEKNPVDMDELGEISKNLDKYMDDILGSRSIVGGKSNTTSAVKENNEENIIQIKSLLSNIQDVDFTEKYVELKTAELIYNSCMQVGAKLIQPTILDYLR